MDEEDARVVSKGDRMQEIARRFFEAIGELDADSASALVTEDYEGFGTRELPIGGKDQVYRGPMGLRAWIEETAGAWDHYEIERIRFRRFTDALVAIGMYRVSGQKSPFGILEHSLPFVAVMRFEDDRISSIRTYARYADAIAAEDLADGDETPSLEGNE